MSFETVRVQAELDEQKAWADFGEINSGTAGILGLARRLASVWQRRNPKPQRENSKPQRP